MRSSSERPPTFTEFWAVWRELLEDSERTGLGVLVEGERDRRSLRRLGLRAPILLVHRGAALSRRAVEVGRRLRTVVVLTDWDAAGGALARRLKELLDDGHLEVDLRFRRRLGIALRGEVVHLEGLDGWARRRAAEEAIPIDEWIAEPDRSRG